MPVFSDFPKKPNLRFPDNDASESMTLDEVLKGYETPQPDERDLYLKQYIDKLTLAHDAEGKSVMERFGIPGNFEELANAIAGITKDYADGKLSELEAALAVTTIYYGGAMVIFGDRLFEKEAEAATYRLIANKLTQTLEQLRQDPT
jgi:hypothetical protein